MPKRLLTVADGLLILSSLVLLGYLFSQHFSAGTAQVAIITDHTGHQQHIELQRDQYLSVQGAIGESHLQVAGGRLRFTDSPCSNKLCIHSGWIHYGGETVACLPNRLSVQLAGHDNDFDAINF
ncbi:NusG domain II-containing protein [Sulfuriflexus mobilis]|uniref:NusG domain II-containing protein n=1 Tax=Sulfuriflexus mobilis TaxID=1811807 RepID=UPI000F832853|nr:NusG domain II-containing protein [Sulfuriflexus mobilis]